METQPKNALVKVREALLSGQDRMTLADIREKTNLPNSSISMALCHLRKQRYVTRELVENKTFKARKKVWSYLYHPERICVEQLY